MSRRTHGMREARTRGPNVQCDHGVRGRPRDVRVNTGRLWLLCALEQRVEHHVAPARALPQLGRLGPALGSGLGPAGFGGIRVRSSGHRGGGVSAEERAALKASLHADEEACACELLQDLDARERASDDGDGQATARPGCGENRKRRRALVWPERSTHVLEHAQRERVYVSDGHHRHARTTPKRPEPQMLRRATCLRMNVQRVERMADRLAGSAGDAPATNERELGDSVAAGAAG